MILTMIGWGFMAAVFLTSTLAFLALFLLAAAFIVALIQVIVEQVTGK